MPELWGPSNERIWRFLGLDGDDEQPENDLPPPRYLTPLLILVLVVLLLGVALAVAL
jgi:hypothetical protein